MDDAQLHHVAGHDLPSFTMHCPKTPHESGPHGLTQRDSSHVNLGSQLMRAEQYSPDKLPFARIQTSPSQVRSSAQSRFVSSELSVPLNRENF
jgi:hypothetical protein